MNAIPKGDIHAKGTFGPWDTDSPGDSSVAGHYTFDHADLNTIKGIGGILSSVGEFTGQLNHIVADGTTETPDFSLDTANHPMPLHTKFHAIVDGTNGDTYLQPVQARLGGTDFTCSGAVVNVKGQGHIIDLDTNVPNGRIQDFLQLGVKTTPVVMTGVLTMKAKLHIPPGKESVTKKMGLRGIFTLRQIHFTNPDVEDKVDMLSLRAQGDPKAAKPGAEDVHSQMAGQFVMGGGKLSFSRLNYTLPGAEVTLTGEYTLSGDKFEFAGNIKTNAKLSQMVALKVEVPPPQARRSVLQKRRRRRRNSGQNQRNQIRAEVRAGPPPQGRKESLRNQCEALIQRTPRRLSEPSSSGAT
ncbi:MAG: hypothetical protein WDN23_21215 [Edaphobacter sp.]